MPSFPTIFLGASLLALLGLAPCADAQEGGDAVVALELGEAQALALEHQPLLEAEQAAVRAARESAVAAAQLPDPQLSFEVRDLPVNGDDAGSFTRDSDTQTMLGISQEFPAGDTRRLRGERGSREAELAGQMLLMRRLELRRDAGLAWVEVWKTVEALELVRKTQQEAELQLESATIAHSTGRASQAEVLAARVDLDLVRDRLAELRQQESHTRSSLSRWIVDDAWRPLRPDLPAWGPAPELATLLDRLGNHPHLGTEARRVAVAAMDVELARQAYKTGWRVGVSYGYRPSFPEMVSVQVGMDLPLFTGKRQDRNLAAKLAQQEQAEQQRADALRQHTADARLNSADWLALQERLKLFDQQILPQSEQRIAAAMASWQNGQATLGSVLDARRMALEYRLKRLELQADAAKHRLNLQYLAGESS